MVGGEEVGIERAETLGETYLPGNASAGMPDFEEGTWALFYSHGQPLQLLQVSWSQ